MSIESELRVGLDARLPERLEIGRGNALSVCGWCFHPRRRIVALQLRAGEEARPTIARGMPRPDVRDAYPAEPRALRSGFWGEVPLAPRGRDGAVEVSLVATLADGSAEVAKLAEVELLASRSRESSAEKEASTPANTRIAICMATFNPPLDLFERQIASIRAQTHTNWTCVICDDHSDPERFERIGAVLGDDPRFFLHRSARRAGFYRNFERALTLAPGDASLIALCDQDDFWHPEKLEALASAIREANLVYSDQRIVDPGSRIVSSSYWTRRRNNFSDLTSLLIANTVTGAASLFRRELLDIALPFPCAPGTPYHDHWLALAALASGEIAYVDRPLYDYVQHSTAQLGHARANRAATPEGDGQRRGRLRPGWRGAYFADYRRLRLLALILKLRCGDALSPAKRRALAPFLGRERPLVSATWFAIRSLRLILGRNETLGAERNLAGAMLWRSLIGAMRGHLARLFGGAAPPG